MKKDGKKLFGFALVGVTVAVLSAVGVYLVKSLASALEGAMTVSGRCYDEAYHKKDW